MLASGVLGSALLAGSLQKQASSHTQRPLGSCRMMCSHEVLPICPVSLCGRMRIGGGDGGGLSGRGGGFSKSVVPNGMCLHPPPPLLSHPPWQQASRGKPPP